MTGYQLKNKNSSVVIRSSHTLVRLNQHFTGTTPEATIFTDSPENMKAFAILHLPPFSFSKTGFSYTAQAVLDLVTILLPQLPKYWIKGISHYVLLIVLLIRTLAKAISVYANCL